MRLALVLVLALASLAACGDSADPSTSSSGGGDAASPDGGAPSCISKVTPDGVTVRDDEGRVLNARGIHLVDWDGFLANPSVSITLEPPADASFPASATIEANHPRLYFDRPSTVGASGPSKTVTFPDATTKVTVRLGIFPDRDGNDETYHLTVAFGDGASRTEELAITVHDQDEDTPLATKILVDFSQDETGFFGDATAKTIVQQAADDWAYFLADPPFDSVAANAESTFIWSSNGFTGGTTVKNANAYTGFLLYVYGISSTELRSGGEGSAQGGFQTSNGTPLPLRRSGSVQVETKGNYNTLGWQKSTEADEWWTTDNLKERVNDLYAIVHHEMGHAHGFNTSYTKFQAAKAAGGLTSPALTAYLGEAIEIDATDHFQGVVDPASGFGAFGNEYEGVMPRGRWLITRLDLLALEAIGYKLRPTLTFETWKDVVPDCP